MCGIAGIVGHRAEKLHLTRMLDQIYHRGPDGIGEFVDGNVLLGMRRLSIIDVEHGWQPLKSRNNRVIAFQNGEIYNYQQLRRELEARGYVFATGSDTEILAHGYDAWGWEKLLQRIDGMYAISIFDRDTRQLYLARDRFGEKPFFYTINHEVFAYGSSIKSLATLPWVDLNIDPIAIDRYLALHYVPGELTIFRGIKRLLPGYAMTIHVDDLQPQLNRYYQMCLTYPCERSIDEITSAVEEAIQSRLVSDVPVGVFLSGGIDSSIIAAVAVKQNPNISTYSIGFPDSSVDESAHAESVARYIGSKHHAYYFDSSKFIELLPQVAASLDEPIGDQAILPLYWLCREARKNVKVVLSGEGGDELFGGYNYYQPFSSPTGWPGNFAWIKNNYADVVPKLLGLSTTASGFPILSGPDERKRMLGSMAIDSTYRYIWEEQTQAMLDCARDPLQRATAADIAGWLPDDLLVKLDRIGMAHSLEGRAPFLTKKLVDLAINLAPHQRMFGGQTKIALREVASQLLPHDIVARPKQGFVLPMRAWIKEWFDHMGGVQQYITNVAKLGLDVSVVAQIIENDLNRGIERERLIFALIMLFEWKNNF